MTVKIKTPKRFFDYTKAIWQLTDNICQNVSDVSHIDMRFVSINYVRCKNDHDHGTLATLTPLRFEDGKIEGIVDGQKMRMQSVVDCNGQQVLYLLSVYLPRFTNLSLRDKLVTLAHELWHISSLFDGDLRRFPGKNYVHGNSEKDFDQHAEQIIQRWIRTNPPKSLYDFLNFDLDELVQQHGRVIGQKFASPKLIAVQG